MWYKSIVDWVSGKSEFKPSVTVANTASVSVTNTPSVHDDSRGRRVFPTTKVKILDLPTYDNSNVHTHPSVQFFWDGWNGYKYWMAFTPYTSTANENPSIVASNNGIDWVEPQGITNPIAPAPGLPNYNSDPELVKVGTALRCYWREYNDSGNNILWYKESSDGIEWGTAVQCSFTTYHEFLSPCIIKRSSDWIMWVGGFNEVGKYFTSNDGVSWTYKGDLSSNLHPKTTFWHPFVWSSPLGYEMVCNLSSPDKQGYVNNDTDLYYGTSADGVVWEMDTVPLVHREVDVYARRVYRSSVVPFGDEFFIYTSGRSQYEKIGYVKAKKKQV